MRLLTLSVAALALSLGSLAAQAEIIELAKVKYDTAAQVAGQNLVLNGAGIRYKAIFKVYTAGLYLSAKANTTDAVYAAPGAKRLHIEMLREVDGNEFGRLFTQGIEANTPREDFTKAIQGVIKLSAIFASRKSLVAGDNFSVDYVPGVGSSVTLNGKSMLDAPIKEPEFFRALLSIWLGKKPADANLKQALLGISNERSR